MLLYTNTATVRYVNAVVAAPRRMLFLVVFVTLFVTYLLQAIVFSAGNPITEDNHTYDIEHATSVAYDSYVLVSEQTEKRKFEMMDKVFGSGDAMTYDMSLGWATGEMMAKYPLIMAEFFAANPGAKPGNEDEEAIEFPIKQGELGDIIYWIFEAKTEEGCYSKEGLEAMVKAEDLFLEDEEWPGKERGQAKAEGRARAERRARAELQTAANDEPYQLHVTNFTLPTSLYQLHLTNFTFTIGVHSLTTTSLPR